MTGRYLDWYSNCNNLDVDMTMSLLKKTVFSPSTNWSMNVSILWLELFYPLIEFSARAFE